MKDKKKDNAIVSISIKNKTVNNAYKILEKSTNTLMPFGRFPNGLQCAGLIVLYRLEQMKGGNNERLDKTT